MHQPYPDEPVDPSIQPDPDGFIYVSQEISDIPGPVSPPFDSSYDTICQLFLKAIWHEKRVYVFRPWEPDGYYYYVPGLPFNPLFVDAHVWETMFLHTIPEEYASNWNVYAGGLPYEDPDHPIIKIENPGQTPLQGPICLSEDIWQDFQDGHSLEYDDPIDEGYIVHVRPQYGQLYVDVVRRQVCWLATYIEPAKKGSFMSLITGVIILFFLSSFVDASQGAAGRKEKR